ncbi:hypothetical protein AA313_de0205755 [Arthrobotrys entomopaga]|nr:hypothetical protein AA313_de0205755 [Arthrobotrys entomopaga]
MASSETTQRLYTGQLPPEVLSCLNNARFLHLATCNSTLRPHIALMNYTYIPPTKTFPSSTLPTVLSPPGPGVIIMLLATSKKLTNIKENPQVSLLVHDWVSQRTPLAASSASAASAAAPSATAASTMTGGAGAGAGGGRNSSVSMAPLSPLAQFLQNLNSSELQSYSHTIRGVARVVECGGEEETYYRRIHRDANMFEDAKCYVEGEEGSVVVVVEVEGGKIADWKGKVEDWGLPEED